jgi:3-phenylpropionate/trans-cinnamate dioxygenase ferredoxin reductase subunit
MTSDRSIVIIGGGLAGAKAAESTRANGFDGRVVLVGAEQQLPYERPPLSKAVLRGDAVPSSTLAHDADYYAAHDIETIIGRAAIGLDVATRTVHIAGGGQVPFDAAILATGAAPRRLDVPGADLDGVHYLRNLDDSIRLADAIRAASRVAVVGGGWIGTEVAASARQMGAEVTLIDPGPVPLRRVLGARIGAVFAGLHADNGVALRLGAGVTALRGDDSVEAVVLTDGRVEPADLVVVGIGVIPRVDLAVHAGLRVDGGVVVDEQLESNVAGVYAAGDIANAFHPHYGRHLRVEHWANALNQGLTAGANATGRHDPYTRLPYFFSDQFDLGLEYVGHGDPSDDVVVRGDLEDRKFVAFWHRDGMVTAAMNVNVWDVVDDLKAIVSAARAVDLRRLADTGVALDALA